MCCAMLLRAVTCCYVVQAMQWIADNVQYPAIVSASIAVEYSAAVNQAVTSLMNDFGITVVAAAGTVTRAV